MKENDPGRREREAITTGKQSANRREASMPLLSTQTPSALGRAGRVAPVEAAITSVP
jgi:hypothetical protein